jgi:hypothetical protein
MLITGFVTKVNIYMLNDPTYETFNRNSEIRVGSMDMNSNGANQASNELCMKQPGDEQHYIWEYVCTSPKEGRYVILYKEHQHAMCTEAVGSTLCFFALEVIIFLAN